MEAKISHRHQNVVKARADQKLEVSPKHSSHSKVVSNKQASRCMTSFVSKNCTSKNNIMGGKLSNSYFFFLFPPSKFPLQCENWKILHTHTYRYTYKTQKQRQTIPPKIPVNIFNSISKTVNYRYDINKSMAQQQPTTQLFTCQNDKTFHIEGGRQRGLQNKNGGKIESTANIEQHRLQEEHRYSQQSASRNSCRVAWRLKLRRNKNNNNNNYRGEQPL